jgi:hypothetical protein
MEQWFEELIINWLVSVILSKLFNIWKIAGGFRIGDGDQSRWFGVDSSKLTWPVRTV